MLLDDGLDGTVLLGSGDVERPRLIAAPSRDCCVDGLRGGGTAAGKVVTTLSTLATWEGIWSGAGDGVRTIGAVKSSSKEAVRAGDGALDEAVVAKLATAMLLMVDGVSTACCWYPVAPLAADVTCMLLDDGLDGTVLLGSGDVERPRLIAAPSRDCCVDGLRGGGTAAGKVVTTLSTLATWEGIWSGAGDGVRTIGAVKSSSKEAVRAGDGALDEAVVAKLATAMLLMVGGASTASARALPHFRQ